MASRLLLVACAALQLSACDSGPSPLQREPLRLGADRQVRPSDRLPPAQAVRGYDAPVPTDDTAPNEKVGAMVADRGGQKAQRAKEEKEHAAFLADRERKRAREASETPVLQ